MDPVISQELSLKIPILINMSGPHQHIPLVKEVFSLRDYLPKLSSWVWGGDGWAYDIGFGGLDHVLAAKTDINVLVMDTEGYSNTGGQVSKSTNLGAVQKFAPAGYRRAKKDLGAIAMAYEDVYVASIAIGANYTQAVKALTEAESFPGASLVLCYSPCIEHKILFPRGLSRLAEEMKKAVDAGYWSLYRFNPSSVAKGENPFTLDSKRIAMAMEDFTKLENRFQILNRTHPEVAQNLRSELQIWAEERHERLKWMASRNPDELNESGIPLSIIYGSDTGTTSELASRLAALCKNRGFNVALLELDEVEPDHLQTMKQVVVLCSTAGEGDFPQNAHAFWDAISDTSLDEQYLSECKVAVFGLGDTGYRHFNAAALNIQKRLEELGAIQWMDIGLGDDKHEDKFETEFEKWLPRFWIASDAPPSANEHLIDDPIVQLVEVSSNYLAAETQIRPPGTKLVKLEQNSRITSNDYERIIRHLVFDLPETEDFSYLLGDALTVYPTNDSAAVTEFLDWYGISSDQFFKVEPLKPLDSRRNASYRFPLTPLQIFSDVIDILGRPSKHFYKQLSKFATDPDEKARLEFLVSDNSEASQEYNALIRETVTYADILKMFPSAHPPIEHLMSLIPCIKPRLYSIASSQRYVNDKVELAIVILDWLSPNGRQRRGLATGYIERLKDCINTLVPCSVTPGTFNFPADSVTPQIMTGLGTGLAPFRAFIQERAWLKEQGKPTGPLWLFYGCRYRSKDYIFGTELEKFSKDGVLTELHPAFSRDQGEKVYVQNKIEENASSLYEDLIVKEGYFYLCGQAGQVELDIKKAVYKVIAQGKDFSINEAQLTFEKLADDGRYCPELY